MRINELIFGQKGQEYTARCDIYFNFSKLSAEQVKAFVDSALIESPCPWIAWSGGKQALVYEHVFAEQIPQDVGLGGIKVSICLGINLRQGQLRAYEKHLEAVARTLRSTKELSGEQLTVIAKTSKLLR
jgi:hypothetical protein